MNYSRESPNNYFCESVLSFLNNSCFGCMLSPGRGCETLVFFIYPKNTAWFWGGFRKSGPKTVAQNQRSATKSMSLCLRCIRVLLFSTITKLDLAHQSPSPLSTLPSHLSLIPYFLAIPRTQQKTAQLPSQRCQILGLLQSLPRTNHTGM